MSDNQIKFLKTFKKNKRIIFLSQISIIFIFFILWEYLSSNNYINSFLYSSPTKVLNTIKVLYNTNNLFIHLHTTMTEIIVSFIIGTILGFLIALILYECKLLAKISEPFLIMLNSLPKVALGPIIIIITGANIKSIIVMALLINLIINITTIYNGFINTDEIRIKLLKTFKASKYQIAKYIIIPESFNTILSSLKLTIGQTLIGVIMGEFLVSKAGIGYLIIYGTQVFNMSLVMTGILFLAIISFLLYEIVLIIEKKLLNSNKKS